MSWDADLHVPGDDAGDIIARLNDWCREHPLFSQTAGDETSGQWWYENEDTGVYFSVEFGPEEDRLSAEGHTPAEIAVNVNYARPHYFALEAMPVVTTMVAELGCTLVDHQGDEAPEEPAAESLIESWDRGNATAVRVVLERSPNHPRWSRDEAHAWWQYQRSKSEISEALADEDVFVPTLMLVTLPDSPRVVSVAVWPDAIAVLLPRCDLIAGRYDRRKLFRKETVEMLYRTEDVRQALGSRLTQRPLAGMTHDLLLPEDADDCGDVLARMEPVGPQSLAAGRRLNQLAFVEV